MAEDHPRTGPRHEPDRIYERASDPAEAVNRPLEPKSGSGDLSSTDEPHESEQTGMDPHHVLNNPVGEIDPDADSDPYRKPTEEDEQDRASGTRGSGEGAEDR
jgi:hypothetical protein